MEFHWSLTKQHALVNGIMVSAVVSERNRMNTILLVLTCVWMSHSHLMPYSIICWVMIAKLLLKILSFLPLTLLLNMPIVKRTAKVVKYTSQIGKRTMDVNVCTMIGLVYQHVIKDVVLRGWTI